MKTTGRVNGIISNIVIVKADGPVGQNEICYVWAGDTRMMAEVIKVIGDAAYVQVFDSTRGLKIGDKVEFEGHMLEVTLAPGLLSRNYDGLQNDLEKMDGLFIARGSITDPIDFDAAYLPAFAGERSPELGTAAYQHPARTAELYDERLDDYPAALISTALHALACDPTLLLRYGGADGLLLTPQRIPGDDAYREITALFRRRGMALPLRIAELLAAPTPHLCGAAALFALAAAQTGSGDTAAPGTNNGSDTDTAEEEPELFVEQGRWGYRTPQRVVIAPLYDCGFDFTEGLAAVRLGDVWHYIDTAGRTRISCPGCEAVKPFRNGRAQVIRDGRRRQIDRTGREFDI